MPTQTRYDIFLFSGCTSARSMMFGYASGVGVGCASVCGVHAMLLSCAHDHSQAGPNRSGARLLRGSWAGSTCPALSSTPLLCSELSWRNNIHGFVIVRRGQITDYKEHYTMQHIIYWGAHVLELRDCQCASKQNMRCLAVQLSPRGSHTCVRLQNMRQSFQRHLDNHVESLSI